ncbi:DUF6968 family protein [Psychromonas aquimarina]|uniref:DUF6968 family protein n=1 Tax=Psychromonas aquimarina TaxID=444919 RepID=UPI00048B7C33|nr:hypothetical protein [Psychromonas aquimarina]
MRQSIAESSFIAVHSKEGRNYLEITVYSPEQNQDTAHTEFGCTVELKGLLETRVVFGIDSFQALSLAVQSLQADLKQLTDNGWSFFFKGYEDMPIDVINCYFPNT